MTKNLFLDFIREIRKSMNRFLSIMCIVAIGVAVFAGLRSATPDMTNTIDEFFDKYNIMDVQVISTLGLTEDDIEAIRQMDGVDQVQPGYLADVLTNIDGMELVFRLHSLPNGYENGDYLNMVELTEGRLPQAENEIVIEDSLNVDYGINVGDILTFSSGTETPITEDTLKTESFTVVGKVTTPYYLTYERGNSQINGLSISLFAYIPQNAFAYEDLYIDAMVTFKDTRALNAFSSKYEKLIEEYAANLGNIGTDRSAVRSMELISSAKEQLEAYQKEYEEGLAKYNKEIAEGQKQLEEAQVKIATGESELASGKERYEEEVAAAEKEIAEGEEALAKAQEQYDNAKATYDSSMEASAEYRSMLNQLATTMDTAQTAMDAINAQIIAQGGTATAEQEELLANWSSLYTTSREQYENITTLNNNLNDGIAQIEEVLAETEQTLEESKQELADGKRELAQKKEEAQEQFAAAEKELAQGKKDYEKGLKEFNQKKEEGQKQLDEAQAQLIAGKYEIERIETAEWYILDRTMNYGFASYKATVKSMNAMASIIPVFFLIVAVLVCMTTMTRMVTEHRTLMGTYKALGYDDNAIALKYVLYVVAASLVGGILGSVIGVIVFPSAVYTAWSPLYNQPELHQSIHVVVILISFVVTVIAMAITAYYTCQKELKEVAAQLMRPKAPKIGKAIMLERIPFIWERLNFSQKVTARNIFRYKKRLLMTVIGIMGCAALLLAGLGMNDTISTVVGNQYGKIFQFDMSISTATVEDAADVCAQLDEIQGVKAYTTMAADSATISFDNKSESVSMFVPENEESMEGYILLQNRVTGKKLRLGDEGIVITEKLAEALNVEVGDYLEVADSNYVTKSIPISGIAENYVFHYAYMSEAAYINYFKQQLPQNQIFVLTNCSDEEVDTIINDIKDLDSVSSVTSYGDLADDFGEQISAIKSIVLLIIACAALLAFVVLYNLTNINISERIREIATIKVLGFNEREVAMYVYRENFVLTLLGAVCGLAGGIGLHRLIIKSIEQNNIMYGYVISPVSFVGAIVLTCVFSIVVMLYMYRKLVTIPMVESLKSVE